MISFIQFINILKNCSGLIILNTLLNVAEVRIPSISLIFYQTIFFLLHNHIYLQSLYICSIFHILTLLLCVKQCLFPELSLTSTISSNICINLSNSISLSFVLIFYQKDFYFSLFFIGNFCKRIFYPKT